MILPPSIAESAYSFSVHCRARARWRDRRRQAGQPTGEPNMVIGADVHTCWEKFANYFEVEARIAALVGQGYSPREASDTLVITENTARSALRHLR